MTIYSLRLLLHSLLWIFWDRGWWQEKTKEMHFEAVPEIISDYWLRPLESLEPFEKCFGQFVIIFLILATFFNTIQLWKRKEISSSNAVVLILMANKDIKISTFCQYKCSLWKVEPSQDYFFPFFANYSLRKVLASPLFLLKTAFYHKAFNNY